MADNVEIIIKVKDDTSGGFRTVKASLSDAQKDWAKSFSGMEQIVTGAFRRVGEMIVDVFANIAKSIVNSIKSAIGFVVDQLGNAINQSMAFEKTMRGVQTAFGATGEEAKRLGGYIDELSLDPTLRVSSDEAAMALEMLGKAGISTEEAISGVARGAALLGNATGEGIPLATEVAIKAMAAWGYQAKDMEYIANQVTGATESSTLSLQDMFLAYSMGGGAAAAAGVEFSDFNAIMAASITLFSSGSDAGTSFKTFLDRLIPASNEAADRMRELGLFTGSTTKEFEAAQEKYAKVQAKIEALDPLAAGYSEKLKKLKDEQKALSGQLEIGSNKFFDQNGQMKSAQEIAKLLQDAFGGLTEERRKEALSTIFGTDAQRTAIALMNQGAAGIQHYQSIIGDTSAQERAAMMTDNTSDRFDNLKETMQVLSRRIGDVFLPAADKIITWLKDMFERWQPRILEVFGNIGDSVGGLVDDFISSTPQFDQWIDGMLDGLDGLIDNVKDNWGEMKDVLLRTWGEIEPVLTGALEQFKTFGEWFGTDAADSPIKWAVEQVATVTGWMQVLADTMTAISELTNLSGRQINAYLRLDFNEAGRLGGEISKRMTQIKNFDNNIASEIASRMAKFGYKSSSAPTPSGGTIPGMVNPYNFETEKLYTGDNGSSRWMTQKEAQSFFSGNLIAMSEWWNSDVEKRYRYYAKGGMAGGWSWVGENGPELVNLPHGTQVHNAQDSQRMAGRTINIANLNMQGGSNGIDNLTSVVTFVDALYG